MPNSKKQKKPIAYMDNVVAFEEGLPLPYAFYPGHYGAFFGFSSKENGEIYLCSCAFEAVKNYMTLRRKFDDSRYATAQYSFVLSSKEFPLRLVEELINGELESDEAVFGTLKFQTKICHECNSRLPSYRYCHEMYGTVFAQNYGWYVKKQGYEFGIDNLWMNRIEGKAPSDIDLAFDDDLKSIKNAGFIEITNQTSEEAKMLQKRLRDQNRVVRNLIENEVRRKFGHKNVGEAWTSETILYYLIQDMCQNFTVRRHFRPVYLEGLELDVYIEELNMGIEYQGVQHFKPITHWGGETSFLKLIERDKRKKILCSNLGIELIYFNYDEELSSEYVKQKLRLASRIQE
jgi:hypothetical protein